MTRLDMSEFMEKHMAQRLQGAPPGYVDSDQGAFDRRCEGAPTACFTQSKSACRCIQPSFCRYSMMRSLTDGRGRTADFSNTVVIMTSNIT